MVSLYWINLLVLVATGQSSYVNKNDLSDLCFVCSCSKDYATADCSQRGLTDIRDISNVNDKVKKLNLSNNEIATFPRRLGHYYNLISLDLSGNQLKRVPEDGFFNLTSLEMLNLSKNSFETWRDTNPNEILLQTPKLKILDLSHNKFYSMDRLANNELLISPSLETLILESCEISSIQGRSPFSGLINLRVLRLNNNPLVSIQSLVSPTLRSLYVSNCRLTSINNNELSYLPELIYLKMSHNYRLDLVNSGDVVYSNSLKYLDISYCNIMNLNLAGFPNLRRAIVNHNMIRSLKGKEFVNNTNLEYLDLSNNNIGSLKQDTFRKLTILKNLDLSWNEIAFIPDNSLLEMPSLTELRLARNYLTSLGHLKSTSVTVLDMSSCEINTISKDSLEGMPSLIDLDLSRNLISRIPDSISSNTLKYLNLNYNRINSITNFTFFMLPRLTGLSVIGNRFTTLWNKSYFKSNPYLEKLELEDNMWRCDCSDANMYDFYEYVTLEPNKKEESYNLICNSPANIAGQTWLEACFFEWNPTSEKAKEIDGIMWFIIVMIIGLSVTLIIVSAIRRSMKRRLAAIQLERERQIEEARDRLRQLRIQAEQEALCNAPDPRDLVAPPSYDEALSMPKLNVSCHSLLEAGTGRSRRKRGRRKTKSSGDLLDETERNGDLPVLEDIELSDSIDNSNRRRRRRRQKKFGSHEIAELDVSPGARRRRISEYNAGIDSITVEVEAELERPLRRPRDRRYSYDSDEEPRESNF